MRNGTKETKNTQLEDTQSGQLDLYNFPGLDSD